MSSAFLSPFILVPRSFASATSIFSLRNIARITSPPTLCIYVYIYISIDKIIYLIFWKNCVFGNFWSELGPGRKVASANNIEGCFPWKGSRLTLPARKRPWLISYNFSRPTAPVVVERCIRGQKRIKLQSVIGVRSFPLCPWISNVKVEGQSEYLINH